MAPDYNQSAVHADLWLSPKPGTDAALALGACQVILAENLYDADYVREQTDLPFLVRTDNRKFLRQTDMEPGEAASDSGFYFWDEPSDGLVKAPATGFGATAGRGPEMRIEETLRLGDLKPALEGRWTVDTVNGPVEVTTVFELTREHVQGYTPERAAEITGGPADNIRAGARQFARAKPGMIYSRYRSCK